MANFFDQLAARYDSTQPFAPEPQQQMNAGAMASPFETSRATVRQTAMMTPVQQPLAQQPVVQPPQPVQATADTNPFDQFDTPADTAPIQYGDNSVETTEAQRVASETFNRDISDMVNSGATREQIEARVAQEHATGNRVAVTGLDEALAYRDRHHSPIAVGVANDAGLAKPADYHARDRGALDAAGVGAFDSITIGAGDELGGAIGATTNAVAGAFGGGTGEDWSDAYGRIRDENRQALNDAQHYHPGAYLGGQIVGGIATLPIGGGEAALAQGGWRAAGRLAGEGAVMGGAYGFNSGTDGVGDRLVEGAKGATLGAVGGAVLGSPMNAVARRVAANRATPSAGREILSAADRLSAGNGPGNEIRPLLGNTSNGGVGSMAQAMLEPTITGGRLGGLNAAVGRFEDQAERTARRIADDAAGGTSTDLTTAAARANDPNNPGSLAAYAGETERAASSVYSAAETASNGAQVPTPSTISRIDEILGDWDAVPGGVPGADTLRALRNDLANGPNGGTTSAAWTIPGLRRLRTSFGDRIESGQRELKEAAKRIWGPLSDDIFRGLRVAGQPDAARLYRQADRQWAQRVEHIGVINRVLGKDADLSADAVATRLSNMSQKDYGYLSRALGAIDPVQAQDIRGGLINQIGEMIPSRATVPGQFSLESFATRWGKVSDQAKTAMFGATTVRDLNDLATLAGSQRAVGQLGNSSRSGIMNENWKQSRAIAVEAGALVGGAWNPAVWGGLGLSAIAGRALATPMVARALVRGAESRSLEVLTRRLGEAARRYPAAEQDIFALRDAITAVPNGAITINLGDPQKEASPAGEANPFDQFD